MLQEELELPSGQTFQALKNDCTGIGEVLVKLKKAETLKNL